MSAEIKDFTDARVRARRFVEDRYPRAKRIYLGGTWGEKRRLDGVWRDKGQNGIFFTTRKSFQLQMSAENGEVMRYREVERRKGWRSIIKLV